MWIDPRTHFIIPKDLSEEIVQFTQNNSLFADNSYSLRKDAGDYEKQFVNINRIDIPLKEKVAEFASECYKFWNIEIKREFMFGNFISVTTKGNALHLHTDPRNNRDDWHVRLNFMVQKPESGGIPLLAIDDKNKFLLKEVEIEESHSWINFASEWGHATTKVDGDRNRIVLSLGSYVESDVAQKLLESFYRD